MSIVNRCKSSTICCLKNSGCFDQKLFEKINKDDFEEAESIKKDVDISRPLYTESNFRTIYEEAEYTGFQPLSEAKRVLNKNFGHGKESLLKQVNNRLPCIEWIRNYNFKECFVADLLAGIIVGCTHIPQGIAYANLASLPAVYGLYTSFFPVLMYWIFGTSKQNSYGTFSLVAFLTASALSNLSPTYIPPVKFNQTANNIYKTQNPSLYVDPSKFLSIDYTQAKVLAATAICFWVGIVHIFMFIFQLGFLTQYLSESFIASFTCGYSVHIFSSQLKNLFGLPMSSYNGIFKVIKVRIYLF